MAHDAGDGPRGRSDAGARARSERERGRAAAGPAAEEKERVERARAGDREAFRQLVEDHEAGVVRLARRWLRDDEAARDVAQEVFLKAYRSLDRFEGRSRFSTWLYRLTVNQCHDWRRREQARPFLVGGDSGPEVVEALEAEPSRSDPAHAVEAGDLRRGIANALATLPEEMRVTLTLREIDGLAYAEIAEVLDIPKGTVMSRLHNARRRLSAELTRLGWSPDGGGRDGTEESGS